MFSIQAPDYKLFLKTQYCFYADIGRGYRFMQDRVRILSAQSVSDSVDNLVLSFRRMLDRCQCMNDCIQHEILDLRMTLSQPHQIILDQLLEAPCLPLEDFQQGLDQQHDLDIFIDEEHTWMGICLQTLLKEPLCSELQSVVLELQDYLGDLEPLRRGLLNLYLGLKDYQSKLQLQALSGSKPLRAFNQASVLRQYLARGGRGLEPQASTDIQALRIERLKKACKIGIPTEIEEAPDKAWDEDFDDSGENPCFF